MTLVVGHRVHYVESASTMCFHHQFAPQEAAVSSTADCSAAKHDRDRSQHEENLSEVPEPTSQGQPCVV